MHNFLSNFQLVLLLSVAFASNAYSQDTNQPPNILFIFSDDHATNAVGAYGSQINETPNIDRLAQQGMLFQNAFCTNGLCAPSRASILTGQYSHFNGVRTNNESFDGSQTTFPKLLQQSGYDTALFGKWHLKSQPTGFNSWEVLPGQGLYYNPDFVTPSGMKNYEGYVTDIVTDLSLDWLQNNRDAEKPFLLMMQHKSPHRIWSPGLDHLDTYDDVDIPEPPTLFDNYLGRASPASEATMRISRDLNRDDLKLNFPVHLTPTQRAAWEAAYSEENQNFDEANLTGQDLVRWKYQRYIKDYLRTVAGVDDSVGEVLDYLEQSGLAEDTIVVYSSDQGFFLGEHGWYDKRFMYEESLRIPLIVSAPGLTPSGSENSDFVQNIDLAQTFLEVAGVEPGEAMQGNSLVPLLRAQQGQDWREVAYYHFYEHPGVHNVARHRGVRTDRYKLIHYYQKDEWELFDLQNDPQELHSVYYEPSYTPIVESLKQELMDQRRLHGEITLASESFSYDVGDLPGNHGGSGFDGPWFGGGQVQAAALTDPPVGGTGKSITAGDAAFRKLAAPIEVARGERVYVRFLINDNDAATSSTWGGFSFFEGTAEAIGAEQLFLGERIAPTTFGINSHSSAGSVNSLIEADGETHTLVAEILFSNRNEGETSTINLFVDPAAGQDLNAEPDASLFVPIAEQGDYWTLIRFAGNSDQFVYDELAIGGTYADVSTVAGDFDGDGDVDGEDFLSWQRGESPNPLSRTDLSQWRAAYGSDSTNTTNNVPEPPGLLLMAICISLVLRQVRGANSR